MTYTVIWNGELDRRGHTFSLVAPRSGSSCLAPIDWVKSGYVDVIDRITSASEVRRVYAAREAKWGARLRARKAGA